MKTYELITDTITAQSIVKATNEDGSGMFIPTDPANSDYAEYLRYTAWVEAGNNPTDFWGIKQTDLNEEVVE